MASVSCVVRWLDKKQNKPVWSGEGLSQIKRFKAPFAHEYLMPAILCKVEVLGEI